jgi:GNAT superfamily N-acetyltransferase
MGTVPVLTYYLEMTERPVIIPEDPPEGLTITKVDNISLKGYRDLYVSVGGPYRWYDRVLMEDMELQTIINEPGTEIHVLRIDGEPSGYFEIDRKDPSDVEIVFLGIVQQHIGKGMGKYLLGRCLSIAWKENTVRVWLHTCEWDHERALPMYIKAGFTLFKKGYHDQKVPDQIG